MTDLEFTDPCGVDKHLGFDGKKNYDTWLDFALEKNDGAAIAVQALKEEYNIETTSFDLVNEDISYIMSTTHNLAMAQSIAGKLQDGKYYFVEDQYDSVDVLSFSCKDDIR